MIHNLRRRLIAGIDGSPAADLALSWAIDEAGRQSLPLHLVHARQVDDWWRLAGVPLPHDLLHATDPIVEERVEQIRRRSPHLTVTGQSTIAHAAQVLVELSHESAAVVLGTRGRRPVSQAMLGSVSAHVSAHAHCPVVVVHGATTEAASSAARVVVGVDGSECSDTAVSFAFRQASARSIGLTAIHSWTTSLGDDWKGASTSFHEQQAMMHAYRNRVFKPVATLSAKYPGVDVRECIRLQDPVTTLIAESRRATLVVLGTRGLGGFAGLLMGSVSRAVLAQAVCPVAVVPLG